ncbi:MAG: FixH family protein [Brevibacillus sp.]|nr:FixH family protein [Brevibacillus sp.]
MKQWTAILLAVIALTAACGNQETHDQAGQEGMLPIEVSSSIVPESPQAGETVTFSVTVKHGDQAVDDAKEVRFELWREGQDEHEFVDASGKGEGVYTAEKSFSVPGTYYMMYHVTARGFHSMDKQSFTVGGEAGQSEPHQESGHSEAGHKH